MEANLVSRNTHRGNLVDSRIHLGPASTIRDLGGKTQETRDERRVIAKGISRCATRIQTSRCQYPLGFWERPDAGQLIPTAAGSRRRYLTACRANPASTCCVSEARRREHDRFSGGVVLGHRRLRPVVVAPALVEEIAHGADALHRVAAACVGESRLPQKRQLLVGQPPWGVGGKRPNSGTLTCIIPEAVESVTGGV